MDVYLYCLLYIGNNFIFFLLVCSVGCLYGGRVNGRGYESLKRVSAFGEEKCRDETLVRW